MKKISVIIPVYNAEKFIEDTIESVLNQKYKNLEIILIDDGSKDKSREIIKKYQDKYPNIKLYCQKNAGAPEARNNGIKNSTGDYVIFLDSDDTLCPNVFGKITHLLENNAELVIGNFNKVDENGKFLCHSIITKSNKVIEKENILDYCMIDPKPGCKIYNLDIIKKNNLIFDNVKIGQDLNFFLKYLILIKNINFVDEYLYNYRIVSSGISRTYSLKILDIENSFKYTYDYYKQNDRVLEYNKYIAWTEYFNYYFQYCKLRFFGDKQERNHIYKFFNTKRKEINLNKESVIYKKYKKLYYKTLIRYLIGPMYTTECYHVLFKKIKGDSHV